MSITKQQPLLNTSHMASARTMRKLRRDRQIERLRLQRKTGHYLRAATAEWANFVDLKFSDEERYWLVRLSPCPICRSQESALHVRNAAGGVKLYSIKCIVVDCNHRTPEFKSSHHAVQNWKLTAALTK